MPHINDLGQPIGRPVSPWTPPEVVPHVPLGGRYVGLRPLEIEDGSAIYSAFADAPAELWTYMGFEPFRDKAQVEQLIRDLGALPDWHLYAIGVDDSIEGFAAYLRINPADGVVEIGSILYSPALQRTRAATEAIYLMIEHAFSSGYRRIEWKCDDLNAPSLRAGRRLGFRYEGTFRNATTYKGRNRDTAWLAMTVEDWPVNKATLTAWLDPANFDDEGKQISPLGAFRVP